MTYEKGQSFGEKAMQQATTRAGSCVAKTEIFCGLVKKELYMKVLDRLNQDKQ